MTDDEGNINENIFNENVRLYRAKHRVNTGIIESALDNANYQFFYLNNGITILCEELDYNPGTNSPVLQFRNVQIINGGQTAHSLFIAHKKDKLKVNKIQILVRICQVSSKHKIAEKISETTNTQIPVNTRDLHANDKIQRKLEEDFKERGYFYERKNNQYMDQPNNKRLNNELLGQIFIAYHFDLPSQAKNDKSLVFGEYYDDIFNEEKISAEELLKINNLYLPLLEFKKEIQRKKRKKEKVNEKEAYVSRATLHILNVIKIIIEREIELIKKKYEDDEIDQKINDVYTKRANVITTKAIRIVGELVKKERGIRGDLYTHDKFFKEVETNKKLRTYTLKSLRKRKKVRIK
jgi:hypothetical protein